ncbi:MAG: hypothetical protein RR199_03070 [Alistipes sp.]
MMKIYKETQLFLVMFLLVVTTACSYNDIPSDPEDIKIEILDEQGTAIEGVTQTFEFGANRSYKVHSSNINYVKITKPNGWLCELVPSSRHFAITAPQFTNLNAEASGDVVIDITHQDGRTLRFTVPVATIEKDVTLTMVPAEIEGTQAFAYGRQKVYSFTQTNTASVDLAAPKGWTTKADLDNNQITVTAPTEGSDFDKKGNVVVTPRSLRGTAGAATTLAVELFTELPVINFEHTSYNCQLGKAIDIPIDAKNVGTATVSYLPAGWQAVIDLAASKITVTAPALDVATSFAALDALKIDLVSPVGLQSTASVTLGLGLSTLEQIKALSTALRGGLVTVGEVQSGSVVLLNDIDLSSITDPILIGDGDEAHAITFPFDGQNHTLTYSITASDETPANAMLGLFGYLAPSAHISNLTLNATITTTQKTKSTCGALAAINKGATLKNITAQLALSCKADVSGKYDAASVWGGLIGYSEAASYANLVVKGATEFSYMWRFGGIVGELATDSEGSFTDCETQMNIDMPFFMTASNCEYGGITGGNALSNWTYTNLTNRGAISWSFKNAKKDSETYIYALGGILGRGYGTITNCKNYGTITGDDRYQSRRIGGIVGGSGDGKGVDKYSLRMDNCHNYADISTSSGMMGGVIGVAEKGLDNEIKNCSNEGNISTSKSGADVNTIAGFMGAALGKNALINCVNKGRVSGIAKYRASGLIGTVGKASTITITSCRNEGALDITDTNTSKSFPLVAGLVILEKADSKATILTSANTGNITITTGSNYAAHPVYIFQPPLDGKPDAVDPTQCDQLTKDNSAATKITIVNQ